MPSRAEIVRALYGAWRLARLDPAGMTCFDLTFEGFWRSFFAAVLIAPGYAVLVAHKFAGMEASFDPAAVLLVESLAYVIGWAAFPLAALVLTQLLGVSQNYVPLIVASNWAAVLQVAGFLLAMALGLVLPGGLGSLVMVIITVMILFYQWFVARTALQSSGGVALMLVLVDLVLNTAINVIAEGLL